MEHYITVGNYYSSNFSRIFLSKRAIQEHLFIEIDIYSNKITFLLSEVSTLIQLNSETYVLF